MKKAVLILMLLTCIALPALAVDWETNPVFLRGITSDAILTSYDAAFGVADIDRNYQTIGEYPYNAMLDANKISFGHDLVLGYVYLLSDAHNIGVFISHDMEWSELDGDYNRYATADPSGVANPYFLNDYASTFRSNVLKLDAVYSRELSDMLALGASLNFSWTRTRDLSDYNTTATNTGRYRTDAYDEMKDIFYLGSTFGLSVLPTPNLELDFTVEAGGYFGDYRYEEFLTSFNSAGDQYDFDETGDISGFAMRTELDGVYILSDVIKFPFMASYVYETGSEDFGGYGLYTAAAGSWPYTKEYDEDYTYHTFTVGAGVNVTPESSRIGFYWWGYYKYYIGDVDVYSLADETDVPLINFDRFESDTNSDYRNHTLGLSVGSNVILTDELTLNLGLNYYFTFINMDQSQNTLKNYAAFSWYDYSGDGYDQYLGANVGLVYETGNLRAGLTATIPFYATSDYDIGGANSINAFTDDPIGSSITTWEFSLLLGLSYAF